jgi:hypothetical protein
MRQVDDLGMSYRDEEVGTSCDRHSIEVVVGGALGVEGGWELNRCKVPSLERRSRGDEKVGA